MRLHAAAAALLPTLLILWPGIPWEALLTASAALLGIGVAAARHEDTKTLRALYEDSPFESEIGTAEKD